MATKFIQTWTGNLDGGMNGFGGMAYPPPYFDIAPSATGRLSLVNMEFSRGAGYGCECRAPFVNRQITDAAPGSCRLHGQTLDVKDPQFYAFLSILDDS